MKQFRIRGIILLFLMSLLTLAVLFIRPTGASSHAPSDYAVAFTDFQGDGFAPSPSTTQLDSHIWRVTGLSDGTMLFGESGTTGDFARGTSTGGVSTGGVYAFEVAAGNNALGIQPGGTDFTPGTFELRLQNQTGGTASIVRITYTIYVQNNEERATSFNLAYSTDGSTFTPLPTMDYTSPEASDALGWQSVIRSIDVTGLSIPDGGMFYVQWASDDISGSGSRDELALDDVEIMPLSTLAATIALFNATAQEDRIDVTWATVAEPDTAGFNVWRATGPTAPQTKLNAKLIDAKGEGQGAEYEWQDHMVTQGVTYYYWLEDVDFYGSSTFVGPIEETISSPMAVTLSALQSSVPPRSDFAAAMLLLGLALAGIAWQRYQRR